MADQEHEDGQEPLSKREQKALQVLAGEIVREAGLVRDQEQEAAEKRLQRVIDGVLEHWKAQIDFFKHMSTASGAALLLLIAVIGAYQPGFAPTLVFLLAAAGFVGSALAAVFYLWVATTRLQLFL